MGIVKTDNIKIILIKKHKDKVEKLKSETMEICKSTNYSLITETPGLKATLEQLARLYQRYHFARQFAKDKEILEAACGSGIGLGYLAKVAHRVVGGDIEENNVVLAKELYHNKQNIHIDLINAHNLPFLDLSFDLVIFYEAIYYLSEPQRFVSEAERVLRENGILIICTVNKDWEDFHPSPYTYKYFPVPELFQILNVKFKEVKMYGGFCVEKKGLRNNSVSVLKRIAIKFNLIPGSLKTRTYLKRLFMGKLVSLPDEVYDDMALYEPPVPISVNEVNKDFKIIYAVAKKNSLKYAEGVKT